MVIKSFSVWYIATVLISTTVCLNVTRGSKDKFTNPRCARSSCTNASSVNCDGFDGANCVAADCFECQCNFANPTFYHNGSSYGKCVKNQRLFNSSGCYRYSDGSSMFTILETGTLPEEREIDSETCQKEKNILAPKEIANQYCSIQWKRTEFLNYNHWSYLPESVLEGKLMSIVKQSENTITLKINLRGSRQLIGQIIRLYIRCESGSPDGLKHQESSTKQGENETHCVLIKFSGSFRSMFFGKMSTTPTADSEAQNGSNSSTHVIIIVVCVILVVLIAAVILFLFVKRKRCGMKQETETIDDLYENTAKHLRAKSAESLNPLYSSGNVAATSKEEPSEASYGYEAPVHAVSSECQLYEPSTNENVYHEPETVFNKSQPAVEHAYEYATPGGTSQPFSKNIPYVGEKNV